MTEKIQSQDARQGRRGTQVLKILIVALVISAAVWVGLELVWN